MANRWESDAREPGSRNQSDLFVKQEMKIEDLLEELETETKLKEDFRRRLENSDADLRAWRIWHESDKIERKRELEEATTNIATRLQEAEKQIENFDSRCLELEKNNQALMESREDEIRKSIALASTLERAYKMYERIVSVWKQRVTSLQADLDISRRECGRVHAELFKTHMRQQKFHYAPTVSDTNTSDTHERDGDTLGTPDEPSPEKNLTSFEEYGETPEPTGGQVDETELLKKHLQHTASPSDNTLDTSDTSDTENYNTPDISEVPSLETKLAKTSEKSHVISEPKIGEVGETVPTQIRDKLADGRHNTQTNRHTHPKHHQKANKRKTTLNRLALVNSNRSTTRCKFCNRFFVTKRTLKAHISRIHLLKSNFSCDFCKQTFTWKHELALHRTKHTGEKPFPCELCAKRFRTRALLKQHSISHSKERPYTCEYCPKRYKQNRPLKVHMRLHEKERPYVCEICNRRFTAENHLNYHRTIHTGEEPYQCEFCPRKHRDPSSLAHHQQKAHSASFPHQCKICALGFRLKSNLQKHRKTCSAGERPYKCSVCDRKFKFSHCLKLHGRSHTRGEPTHGCRECGRRFYEKQYLKAHQRSHLR